MSDDRIDRILARTRRLQVAVLAVSFALAAAGAAVLWSVVVP
jgi:hypothetical protein